ncbi:MAG: TRAP transporter small permease [Pseudomonadales bacterium]|nr:TRAP transporter small permease [Pseudomonadales bacterium]NRA17513.1 TRAP transporter small permease [Oceanospirillaceae bacterium]
MEKQKILHPSVERCLDTLAAVGTLVSALSLIVLVSTFGWLVYGRYILNDSPTWVEQLALLMMITITFMSSATGIRERTHLAVDIIPMLCGPRVKIVLRLICDLILCGFGVLMALKANELLQFTWSREIPLLSVPEGVRYIPVIISGVLVALFSATNVLSGAISLFTYSDAVLHKDRSEPKNKAEE